MAHPWLGCREGPEVRWASLEPFGLTKHHATVDWCCRWGDTAPCPDGSPMLGAPQQVFPLLCRCRGCGDGIFQVGDRGPEAVATRDTLEAGKGQEICVDLGQLSGSRSPSSPPALLHAIPNKPSRPMATQRGWHRGSRQWCTYNWPKEMDSRLATERNLFIFRS